MAGPIITASGSGESIEVYEGGVVIKSGRLSTTDELQIPITEIAGIEFIEASRWRTGAIHISEPGHDSPTNKLHRVADSHSVSFSVEKEDRFREVVDSLRELWWSQQKVASGNITRNEYEERIAALRQMEDS